MNISSTDSGETCIEVYDFEYVGPYLHEPNVPTDNQTHGERRQNAIPQHSSRLDRQTVHTCAHVLKDRT